MKLFIGIIIAIVILLILCWVWVNNIDYMDREHPDYNGNDFLSEGEDEEKTLN